MEALFIIHFVVLITDTNHCWRILKVIEVTCINLLQASVDFNEAWNLFTQEEMIGGLLVSRIWSHL